MLRNDRAVIKGGFRLGGLGGEGHRGSQEEQASLAGQATPCSLHIRAKRHAEAAGDFSSGVGPDLSTDA